MGDLRRLTAGDAEPYRNIRLEGLERHPEAFGAAFEAEVAEPLEFFAARLASSTVFGAFGHSGLLGVGGYFAAKPVKERHKATLFGMYVRDHERGQGLGQGLVEAVLADAAKYCESIRLTVAATNPAARRLSTLR